MAVNYGVLATYTITDYSECEKIVLFIEHLPSGYLLRLKQFHDDGSLKACISLSLKRWADLLSYEDRLDDALRSVLQYDRGVKSCIGLGSRLCVSVASPNPEVILKQYTYGLLGSVQTSCEVIHFKIPEWKCLLSEGRVLITRHANIDLDLFTHWCECPTLGHGNHNCEAVGSSAGVSVYETLI